MDNIEVRFYDEKQWPTETLALLWSKTVEQYGDYEHLWSGGNLTLNEFVRMFAPDSGRLLFLALHIEEGKSPNLTNVIGYMWADDIVGHRAHTHFVFFREFTGKGWVETSIRKGLAILFAHTPITLILCLAHEKNRAAVRVWQHIGVEIFPVTIPSYFQHKDGSFCDAMVGLIRKGVNDGMAV